MARKWPKTPSVYDKDRAKRYAQDAKFTKSAADKKFDEKREKHLKADEEFDLHKAAEHLRDQHEKP